MRELEEKRELLYVIRTMDVLMSSGVGLEAALHTIGLMLWHHLGKLLLDDDAFEKVRVAVLTRN